MKLFVANATSQNHEFHYRTPNADGNLVGQLRRKLIPAGGQEMVAEGDNDVIRKIVDHHVAYGMVDFKDVDRTRGHVGLVYSVDKEIKAELIANRFIDNGEALKKVSAEQRKLEAASLATSLQKKGLPVSKVEMTVTEMKGKEKGDHETVAVNVQ